MPPIYVGKRKDKPWGPDLAFIPIHAVDVRALNAISRDKVFYNLGKNQSDILASRPRIADNIWALVGSPYRLSTINESEKQMQLHLMGYKVRATPPMTRGEFDYVEIRIPLDSENALPTFKGVSGGSLWRAELKHDQNGSLTISSSHKLVGCAFYETEAKRNKKLMQDLDLWQTERTLIIGRRATRSDNDKNLMQSYWRFGRIRTFDSLADNLSWPLLDTDKPLKTCAFVAGQGKTLSEMKVKITIS